MAAAAIDPTWPTALFRPTNRLRDQLREQRGDDSYEHPDGFTEVELFPDLSPEHVLAAGIPWEDFCRFLDDKLVLMGPGVYVYRGSSNRVGFPSAFGELGSSNHHLFVCAPRERETAATATATCDFVARLLATSQEDSVYIEAWRGGNSVPISGPGLFRFFQESQDNLRKVTLNDLILNEEHIRALATTESRPDMEVVLHKCSLLNDNGYHSAFVECLQRDRGPIQLDGCRIDCHVLAAALEGISRVPGSG
jgi:hypothetical protein